MYLEGDLLRVGYWYDEKLYPKFPDPTRLVEPGWPGRDRSRFIRYLNDGHLLTAFLGYSYCRFRCGIANAKLGTGDRTDGHWVWPEGLPHYLECHHVRLPEAFVDHARANGWRVPREASSRDYFEIVRHEMAAGSKQARVPFSADFWLSWAHENKALVE